MKKSASLTAVVVAFLSSTALAEQGSSQLNQIEQPISSTHYSHSELTMKPIDLIALNGDAAKNKVMDVSTSPEDTPAQREYTPSELNTFNR
ncbi:hypothetical protein ACM25P_05185 [Vreelandella alkaliphila]|uniref:hypothetical protein n=1 Tax=Vreelandella alkaliphila TaxID=272774 RepID=UPI0039F5395A